MGERSGGGGRMTNRPCTERGAPHGAAGGAGGGVPGGA